MASATAKKQSSDQPESGRQDGLLAVLNRRLAEQLKRDGVAETPRLTTQPAEPPTVLGIIDNAIALMPGSEVEFSILQRYPNGDFRERMGQAREALCTVRSLLSNVDE